MHIVYADESDRNGQFYFIGALIVDEAAILHIQKSFDNICRIVQAATPSFPLDGELHGYDVFQGRQEWGAVLSSVRAKASVLAIKSISNSGAKFIFRGIDVERHRAQYSNPYPIHQLAFAQALENADEWLSQNGGYRAIVVADEHHTAEDGRRRFRRMTIGADKGYSHRQLTQLVDSIYFGPSKHSRLLQAADMASYFTNRILTIEDEADEARPAMTEIAKHLKAFTARTYIWP